MQTSACWFVYLIRCADQSLYIGITTDIDRRFAEHAAQGKQCAKYLRGRGPLTLVFQAEVGLKAQALRLELRLKRLPKSKKEALVRGNVSLAELASPSASGRKFLSSCDGDGVMG
jgi:putative endonuclease